jgi:hypothetical protein
MSAPLLVESGQGRFDKRRPAAKIDELFSGGECTTRNRMA